MKNTCILFFTIFIFYSCTGEKVNRPKGDEDMTKNMLVDAKVYTEALKAVDIPKMVEFTLPACIEMNGGKEEYTNSLSTYTYFADQTESLKIEIEPKGPIIKGEDNKFYSVVVQKVNQKFKEADPIYTQVNLVAESQDGGVNWKFGFLRKSEVDKNYISSIAHEINKYLDL